MRPICFSLLILFLLASPTHTRQDPALTAEELVAQERLRSGIEEAMGLLLRATSDPADRQDRYYGAVAKMTEIGPDAVPFLISELDQALPGTFAFCSYVLGLIGTPEAEAALRRVAATVDTEPGSFAQARKGWAIYGLGLMGKLDSIDLFNEGKHKVAAMDIHFETSVLEVVAVYNAPASVPPLLAQLDRYGTDESTHRDRVWTLRALGRVGDPRAVPHILPLLKDVDPIIRREAASALRLTGTPEAVDALIEGMKTDDTAPARYAMAESLERILPEGRAQTFVDVLEIESDPNVRAQIYRLIARLGGPEHIAAIRANWPSAGEADRPGLLTALQLAQSSDNEPIFIEGLTDPHPFVVDAATDGLSDLGTPTARAAIRQNLNSPKWVPAQLATRAIVALEDEVGAGIIAKRMVHQEMANLVTDPIVRDRIYEFGNAMLALDHSGDLDELRVAAERQQDGYLVQYLDEMLLQFDTLTSAGSDVTKWVEVMASESEALRKLAYRQLGELGGPEASKALSSQFGRIEQVEGVEVLRAIGAIDDETSRALLLRVLESEAFDPSTRLPLREMAAWGAVRLGGTGGLYEALLGAIERRDGRDAKLLAYLAYLGGEKALPTIDRYRNSRIRYQKFTRGEEMNRLDDLSIWMRADQRADFLRRPPDQISFRRRQ